MAGGDDLVDKSWPVMRPFLLEDGDQNQVKLVKECPLALQGLF